MCSSYSVFRYSLLSSSPALSFEMLGSTSGHAFRSSVHACTKQKMVREKNYCQKYFHNDSTFVCLLLCNNAKRISQSTVVSTIPSLHKARIEYSEILSTLELRHRQQCEISSPKCSRSDNLQPSVNPTRLDAPLVVVLSRATSRFFTTNFDATNF